MAGRGRTTFQKKQKEQKRLERRQQKVARRIARKTEKDNSPAGPSCQSPPPTSDRSLRMPLFAQGVPL